MKIQPIKINATLKSTAEVNKLIKALTNIGKAFTILENLEDLGNIGKSGKGKRGKGKVFYGEKESNDNFGEIAEALKQLAENERQLSIAFNEKMK